MEELTNKYSIFERVTGIFIAVFILLTAGWMYFYNRYYVIGFLEEGQLFRTDSYYFQNYMAQPGGLTRYIGTFLTQFFHWHWVGALLFAAIVAKIFYLQYRIYRRHGDAGVYAFLFFAPAILLALAAMDNLSFRMWHIVGLIITLLLFWIYQALNQKYRDKQPQWILATAIVALFILTFFIAGGNSLIFLLLVVIEECFNPKPSFARMAGLLVTAALLPYFAWQYVYISPLTTAFFSLTPFSEFLFGQNKLYTIAWVSIPVLYLAGRFSAQQFKGVRLKKAGLWIVFSFVLVFAPCIWGMKTVSVPESELIMQMAYEVEQGNWNKVIAIGKTHQGNNAVPISFFTNIALSEKGVLADSLFYYRQTGTYGLFIAWKTHYTTSLYIGEQYYRLGIIQEAEHCAFEAMVTSPTEYGSKAVRRLVETSILLRDTLRFERYIRMMEHSPIYHSWAKQQRAVMRQCLSDSTFVPAGMPQPIRMGDISVDHGAPPTTFRTALKNLPDNHKIFEYLIEFYMLHQDLIGFKHLMDVYYPAMHYDRMPASMEQAMMIYAAATKDNAIVEDYKISQATIDLFQQYNADLQAKMPLTAAMFKKKYGHSYFYYYLNVSPMRLDEIYNKLSVY